MGNGVLTNLLDKVNAEDDAARRARGLQGCGLLVGLASWLLLAGLILAAARWLLIH